MPARTFQEATAVAPFQLASTVTLPAPAACAATAGFVLGCALHGAR